MPDPWINAADVLWPPETFAQRGAVVPFTTPALSGARVRKGPRGIELVVPHPASVRGVYVCGWSEVAKGGSSTVHDVLLMERVAALEVLDPPDIRRAAREVALKGMAGHAARDAARLADERDLRQGRAADARILQMLLTQTEGVGCAPAELDQRGRDAIRRVGSVLNRRASEITSDLERLAGLLAYAGLGDDTAACPQTLGRLERLRTELAAWTGGSGDGSNEMASLIDSAAETTVRLARSSLERAAARLADLPSVLRDLGAGPAAAAATLQELTRAEWLLDGWQQICLVWQLAGAATGRLAVPEMALMVPVFPREVEAWGGIAVDDCGRQRLRRSAQTCEDWRQGSVVFRLIARNEQMRALAA